MYFTPALRWALAALLLGVALSFVAAVEIDKHNDERIVEATNLAAQKQVRRIVDHLYRYQYGLRGARGIVIVAGNNLTRDLFQKYSTTRDVDIEFPGARGFGFIRRVKQDETADFVKSARADGWPDFFIRELSDYKGEHYVIQYIEPVSRNRQAVGLDIASEANRREAAIASMLSGQVQLTGPITLVQASHKGAQSFLLLLPVYRSGSVPKSEEERERECVGWAYAPLLMNEVFSSLHMEQESLQIELIDTTSTKMESFYKSHPEYVAESSSPSITLSKVIFGRSWQFVITPLPSFVGSLSLPNPLAIFGFGSLLSALLSALTYTVLHAAARRRAYLNQKLHLAAIVESSSDAIISKTTTGVVTSWNHGAEKLFGYSASEAVGHLLKDLIVPADRAHEEDEILSQIAKGELIDNFETLRKRKNGTVFDVSVTVSPIYDSVGEIVGASKTVRDITERKELENQLRTLNEHLEREAANTSARLSRLDHLFREVLNAALNVSIIATEVDGTITVFNTGAERMLGYTADEMVGKQTPAIIHLPAEVEARGAELTAQYGIPIEGFRVFVHVPELEGGETRDWTYVRKDGSQLWVSLSVTAIYDDKNELVGYLGIALDVTQVKTREAEREAALVERETLLREVYHRVKNNLQVVSSLLNLQLRKMPIGEGRVALLEAAQRVNSMALVHEKLYNSQNLSSVYLDDYLADLAHQLVQLANTQEHTIKVELDVEKLPIGLDKAVPLGLLVNELLTNSIKHAFRESSGAISIKASLSDGIYLIEIQDDGPGFADVSQLAHSNTLGLRLVRTLSRQLSGTIEFENRQGAYVRLTFPE